MVPLPVREEVAVVTPDCAFPVAMNRSDVRECFGTVQIWPAATEL